MKKISIKTDGEMKIMYQGGQKLAKIKKQLAKAVVVGASAMDVENLAIKLIEKEDALPSFKKVPGYKWATCINVNDGVVHGIPKKTTIFKKGDIVSVDVGIYYKGFHTDTALTVYLGEEEDKKQFVGVCKSAMLDGVAQVKKGKTIGDISAAIEKRLLANDIRPVWSLTGHGVGRELHEQPNIACYTSDDPVEKLVIGEGFVLAVEVMCTKGNGEIKIEKDGWTIRTKDAKIAALFEESVAVTKTGPVILTR